MIFPLRIYPAACLPKIGCMVLLLLAGQSANAKVSDSTAVIHGRGAPTAPAMTFKAMTQDQYLRVDRVDNSVDPDGDEITYQTRWCSEPSGQGSCSFGDAQLMSESVGYYVGARAVTPRGYPQATQGGSVWTELATGRIPKVTNIQVNRGQLAGPGTAVSASYLYEDLDGDLEGASRYQWYVNGVAIAGETAREYMVKETDLNKDLAVEVEPIAQSGLANRGRKMASAVWKVAHLTVKVGALTFHRSAVSGQLASNSSATTTCQQRGMRLPTRAEYQFLYNAYPGNKISSVIGWPTNIYAFWTSDVHTNGSVHWAFRLDNGTSNGTYSVNNEYYLCVSG